MKRLWLLLLGMFVLFSVIFVVGEQAGWLHPARIDAALERVQASPSGLWLVAVALFLLLALDIVLPTPSSVVMVASGTFLGTWLGGLVSFAGAMASALLGYWVCRRGGEGAFQRLVGAGDSARVRAWFKRWGIYAIVLSRPIPMLTEILSCLAGLAAFRFRSFLVATVLGTLPICFIYSYAGVRSNVTNPWPAVWVALVIPALGWFVARRLNRTPSPETSSHA